MTLTPGTRIGPYEVVAPLGAGGMGQVFRAKDTRLGRVVALKAMHESFAQDPDRVARFEREAQLLASLSHPNIAAIYGVEETNGAVFLVLEFIDGRTLTDVLAAGAPPLTEAIAIARQVADALAAAHERGIIHRDLKPGNVMVTADGVVKVLDFGLGKAIDGDSSMTDASAPRANSPTMTMAATQAGIILGTAGYMSPEQAKGRAADKRSDVWAFGCVLFELLSGKRAFDGEDVTEILAAIVRGEPEWAALPAGVSEPLRDLLRRCLIRNRSERLADMSVVQFLLTERTSAASAASIASSSVARPAEARRSIGLPLAAALLVAAVALTGLAASMWPRTPAATSNVVSRVEIGLPDGDELGWLNVGPMAISPDGKMVAYIGSRDGKLLIYTRSLDDDAVKALPGTGGARTPFFSPDGKWIGFFASGKLRKITADGAGLLDLADAADARGGFWAPDDAIYFAPTNVAGIWKVPAAGGTAAVEFTKLDHTNGEISHRWPHVTPDGKTLLFTIWNGPGPDERTIVEQSIATGERHALMKGGDTGQFATPGYLVYGRLDGLFAVPWRSGQHDLHGATPITLRETPRLENEGGSDYCVSTNGTLAYVTGGPQRLAQQLVWVSRDGKIDSLGLPGREYESVALSPDKRQAAVQIQDSLISFAIYDFDRRTLTPFPTGDGSSQAPLWSHDGKWIIYRGTRKGLRNLFMKASDGTGPEVRLTTKENVIQTPTSVTPDGEWALYNDTGSGATAGTNIWKVRLTGDHAVEPIDREGGLNGQVSPDGHWLAFQTSGDRSGQVFVQPFPGPGPRKQISVGGGGFPRWSHDGRELFYETLDRLMSVSITTTPAFSAGTPKVAHEGRYRTSMNSNTHYDVSADGTRFLRVQRIQPERPVTHIDLVLNWFETLKHK